MRSFLLAIFFLLPRLAWSQAPAAFDLTTPTGRTYQPIGVCRVEPDGITFQYNIGLAKIRFSELPEAVQRQYGYDSEKGAAYAVADAKQQEVLLKEGDEARRLALQHDLELAIRTARDIAAIPKEPGVGTLDVLDANSDDGAGGGGRRRRRARARNESAGNATKPSA